MALTTCPKCGKQVSEYAPTCPDCGTLINTAPQKKVFCKHCGAEIAEDVKFCPSCGGSQLPAAKPVQQPILQPIQQPIQQPYMGQGNTNTTTQTNTTTVVVNERGSNGLGTAGFVFSILAFFVCWVPILDFVIWFLGALFSFLGLFKRPRGLAIAGFILSFIGIIILITVFGSLYALFH